MNASNARQLRIKGCVVAGSKHLKLVTGSESGDSSFQIVSLEQIGAAEREKIKQSVHEISPGAGIVGVMRGARSWDLRPVLMFFGESSPTILRFLGPEVALSPAITNETVDLLNHLQKKDAQFVEIGEHHGQLWYRRPLFDRSLAQLLLSNAPIKPGRAFSLARGLANRILDLHKAGIVHGHVCPANVGLSNDDRVALVDAGMGATIVRATKALAIEDFPQGYDKATFAPELLNRGVMPSYSNDVFGLGLVIRAVFTNALRAFSTNSEGAGDSRIVQADVQQMIEFADRLCSENIIQRPTLLEAKELIDNFGRPRSAEFHAPNSLEGNAELARHNIRDGGSLLQRKSANAQSNDEALPSREEEEAVQQLPMDEPAIRSFPEDNFITEKEVAPLLGESFGEPQPEKRSLLPILLLVLAMLSVFYWYQSRDNKQSAEVPRMTQQELRMAWESGLPSRMALVALTAVTKGKQSSIAEDLILRSAINDTKVSGIDASLIRIAFNKQWERNLSPDDRRVALALAMSGLLRDQMPSDLPDLRALHPGVLLAITASAGENARKLLLDVPAANLKGLPIPYGIAFNELVSVNPSLSCGDAAVIQLSRLATFGFDSVEEIATFLGNPAEVPSHLRALAQLSSHDNGTARTLLATILANPNLKIANDTVEWAKHYRLLDWKELESTDQLFLLAGMPPAATVSGENLGKLFSHPEASIRREAIVEGINKIKFSHPASLAILSDLAKTPTMLSAGQTVRLMQILLSYKGVTAESARKFLETKPPLSMAQQLLFGTAHETTTAPIDFELMRYLKEQNWTPDVEQLKLLSHHPDDFTRFYSYRAIFALPDHDQAAGILIDARKSERNSKFTQQLQSMIEFLASEQ